MLHIRHCAERHGRDCRPACSRARFIRRFERNRARLGGPAIREIGGSLYQRGDIPVAGLGAVNQVGESIVGLLRARRSLLADENRLGPVPSSQDIAHVPLAKLTGTSPPNSGLSITCYHIGRSDHRITQGAARDPATSIGISLELSYLLASWSSVALEEQSLLSWAMLELSRYPILDRGQLGGNDWSRDESIQLVPDDSDPERLYRLWESLKQKYRLSQTFKARVIRIGYGPSTDALPVVASRFAFGGRQPALVDAQ
jgi:hypothetical protein